MSTDARVFGDDRIEWGGVQNIKTLKCCFLGRQINQSAINILILSNKS